MNERCMRRLWPGGLHCTLPAKHDGACMYAKPGSALNPEPVTSGYLQVCYCEERTSSTIACPIHDPAPQTTTTVSGA